MPGIREQGSRNHSSVATAACRVTSGAVPGACTTRDARLRICVSRIGEFRTCDAATSRHYGDDRKSAAVSTGSRARQSADGPVAECVTAVSAHPVPVETAPRGADTRQALWARCACSHSWLWVRPCLHCTRPALKSAATALRNALGCGVLRAGVLCRVLSTSKCKADLEHSQNHNGAATPHARRRPGGWQVMRRAQRPGRQCHVRLRPAPRPQGRRAPARLQHPGLAREPQQGRPGGRHHALPHRPHRRAAAPHRGPRLPRHGRHDASYAGTRTAHARGLRRPLSRRVRRHDHRH